MHVKCEVQMLLVIQMLVSFFEVNEFKRQNAMHKRAETGLL